MNLIQNWIELLEGKGVADEVVATILRSRSKESNSSEIVIDGQKVRFLNGRYGKPLESASVCKEELSKLACWLNHFVSSVPG